MKVNGMLMTAVAALVLSTPARSQDASAVAAAAPDSPYSSIVARNIFGLVPIPPPDPNAGQPPPEPPPKITPNGIMTIFGRDQALFKVAEKGKAGQPPKDVSYVLSEGERQNDIEVVKINHVDSIITFNNHGTVQELPLVAPKDTGGSAPGPGGGSGGNPGLGNPRGGNPMAGIDRGIINRRMGVPGGGITPGNQQGGAMGNMGNMGSMAGMGGIGGGGSSAGLNFGGTTATSAANPSQDQHEAITPEQQVILIEAQRMKYIQDGNPVAQILPPTPLTQQALQGRMNGGEAGGAGVEPPPVP